MIVLTKASNTWTKCIMLFVVLLSSLVFRIEIKAQETSEFRFVQITDTHLGIKEHDERTEKIIKSINKLPFKIEFVAHTGDIFSDNIQNYLVTQDGIKLFSKLKVPIYFVPGNHDILDEEFDRTLKIYKDLFSYTDTVIQINNIQFVFLYSEPIADNKVEGADEKLKWVEEILNNNIPTVIFHHNPSVQDFYNNEIHDGWDEDFQKQWTDILNKYNVKAVIAGHFHRNQMHWLGEVPLYIAPSVAAFWERQATYRIYTYSNGKLSYETVYIN